VFGVAWWNGPERQGLHYPRFQEEKQNTYGILFFLSLQYFHLAERPSASTRWRHQLLHGVSTLRNCAWLSTTQCRTITKTTCTESVEQYVVKLCFDALSSPLIRARCQGRAGTKGTAYTFITPEEDRFAGDLVKALTAAKTAVPPALKELADKFALKMKSGGVQLSLCPR
jgi:hypothetical protein